MLGTHTLWIQGVNKWRRDRGIPTPNPWEQRETTGSGVGKEMKSALRDTDWPIQVAHDVTRAIVHSTEDSFSQSAWHYSSATDRRVYNLRSS